MPLNFANEILDLELQIDSGRFDIECIDKLMSLYSVSTKFQKLIFSSVSSWILPIDKWREVHIFHWANSKYPFEIIGTLTDEGLQFEWYCKKVRTWKAVAFNEREGKSYDAWWAYDYQKEWAWKEKTRKSLHS